MAVLKVFHIIISIAVIAGVLLQSGKSAGMSGAIDGGASALLGQDKQVDEKLSKLTTVAAILFMVSSLLLAAL
ncbi:MULTISPECIES: preprotein translocase subunit SecG [unclassified Candidatus Frackibacter]|uniref:preprotein translocase subunit SecG n=1 Tax=unclassified Candidatus Frackibacter TaxID=2648818 RepID=UPI000891259D|nr:MULTISPECIES: preprotein translocase subunit SecG [unclassified Candidatus Frackibacter]SDC70206.1 protein translocase subunit secG [Candidatus Frackibacter sp. WG11]SEM85289.1 protein translocase subunit secG [Candidatus Frackibacter sp. WG12]SFL94496.1 protein translocase subunit secG [Candidatus Frackibacter sp. WG13]